MSPIKLDKNFDSSKAVKNLVRGYKFVPHVDRFLPTWDETGFKYESSPKAPDDAWHPSGDCVPSLNDLYWTAKERMEGKPREPFMPSTVKNFAVGNFWHAWLQFIVVEHLGFATWDQIERRGRRAWGHSSVATVRELPSGESIPWAPFHWVTGSGDVAPATLPGYGDDYLIDFKTQNAQSFRTTGLPAWCAEKYEAQINIYMDFFDLEKALIVCICKDTPHDLKEIEYRRNQDLVDAIYEKWQLVSECLDAKVEPPVDEEFPLPFTGPCK